MSTYYMVNVTHPFLESRNGLKVASSWPMLALNVLKLASSWLHVGSSWLQFALSRLNFASSWLQVGSSWP